MASVDLAIVILNWNAAADTIHCVHQIASWECLRPTIWVVDNASADGSPDAISGECPQVRLIRNSANLGFAGGNNRGIAEALTSGDAPILLLNNDAHIEEADAARLLDTLRDDPRIGFVGPLLYDGDRKERLLSAGGKNPARHHQSHILELTDGEPVRSVECVPGTVVLVRSEVFRTVGLLDEAYFFASEVADLCLQASQHGYRSAIDTRSRAFHNLDRSSDLRSTVHGYYIIRNRFLLIRKFEHTWKIPLFGFWALYGLAMSLKLQLGGRSAAARAIRLGLVDGLRGRFGGQNDRVLGVSFGETRSSNL